MARRPKLITRTQARERFGISKTTMARLVKEGRITIYENPIERMASRRGHGEGAIY